MYRVRSSLMHSGQSSETCKVSGYGEMETSEVVSEALNVTAHVVRRMVAFDMALDWGALELSSPA